MKLRRLYCPERRLLDFLHLPGEHGLELLWALPHCFKFHVVSHSNPTLESMPITEQQALDWAGSKTAYELTALPSFPDGRLRASTCRYMISVSTAVVHCILPDAPEPPTLRPSEHLVQLEIWGGEVLRRDERKRQTLEGKEAVRTGLAHKDSAGDQPFLKTFGYEHDISPRNRGVPFLRVSGMG